VKGGRRRARPAAIAGQALALGLGLPDDGRGQPKRCPVRPRRRLPSPASHPPTALTRGGPTNGVRSVDVVPELVSRNQDMYGDDHVRFLCGDIVTSVLPPGDICLVRQLLQHLSNAEILMFLGKLVMYRDVFITEHYPTNDGNIVPNRDKPHGPDIRADQNSAVYLDEPPFSLAGVNQVLRVQYRDLGELRTFHIGSP
jgi:hypothetical protein